MREVATRNESERRTLFGNESSVPSALHVDDSRSNFRVAWRGFEGVSLLSVPRRTPPYRSIVMLFGETETQRGFSAGIDFGFALFVNISKKK